MGRRQLACSPARVCLWGVRIFDSLEFDLNRVRQKHGIVHKSIASTARFFISRIRCKFKSNILTLKPATTSRPIWSSREEEKETAEVQGTIPVVFQESFIISKTELFASPKIKRFKDN